ncbi:hypothetical protein J2X48_005347 [Bosea sp. BE271]|uniref:hypothetical protein n=1 Tax=Bosea TaxID=85413 RepID=UPI00285E0170|nr:MULTISPECIES: hypothetical protein [Bosea]MDR6831671.1 hypothetical protein [Bosea robiniae]MDR6898382.1 hypothetical protein [Bosea sp. BE109]MDR7141779.1 hypothetical protein [Bosea sp. BE168]MDR7178389.1 hypothetical protein [Bosea sp. BE271]
MLARGVWPRMPIDPLQEEIAPAKIERIPIAMTHLMDFVRRVHDESGDTACVAGPKADTDNPAIERPVRGHAEGHQGIVIGRVDDGVSVHGCERNTDNW